MPRSRTSWRAPSVGSTPASLSSPNVWTDYTPTSSVQVGRWMIVMWWVWWIPSTPTTHYILTLILTFVNLLILFLASPTTSPLHVPARFLPPPGCQPLQSPGDCPSFPKPWPVSSRYKAFLSSKTSPPRPLPMSIPSRNKCWCRPLSEVFVSQDHKILLQAAVLATAL